MCAAVILRKTGRTVANHQRLTSARCEAIHQALVIDVVFGCGQPVPAQRSPREIAAVLRTIHVDHPQDGCMGSAAR